jgi:hypothetical protein
MPFKAWSDRWQSSRARREVASIWMTIILIIERRSACSYRKKSSVAMWCISWISLSCSHYSRYRQGHKTCSPLFFGLWVRLTFYSNSNDEPLILFFRRQHDWFGCATTNFESRIHQAPQTRPCHPAML